MTERLFDPTPVHLVAQAGDSRSVCGLLDPLPVMLARFVDDRPRHTICAACRAALGSGGGVVVGVKGRSLLAHLLSTDHEHPEWGPGQWRDYVTNGAVPLQVKHLTHHDSPIPPARAHAYEPSESFGLSWFDEGVSGRC